MYKIVIAILITTLSCMAGELNINFYSGSPTVIDFAEIGGMEIVSPTAPAGMVEVTGGTFQMGSTTGTSGEMPVHSVTLNSFYLAKYEVTQSEWLATMESNPSNFTGDLNLPVEKISLYDIQVYCNKRSITEGLTPCYKINDSTNPADWGDIPTTSNAAWNNVSCNWLANGYRIPTEAEWEFAARGGINSQSYLYSGSNTADSVAWYAENSVVDGIKVTHIVGLKKSNELGLYDMSGNVTERVWDWESSYTADPQTNPTGPSTVGSYRKSRGGSCTATMVSCTVSRRGIISPQSKTSTSGVRLARSAL